MGLTQQLLWVRHFRSIPELVRALQDFRALYNQHWLIERLGFQSPAQARQRLAIESAALIMVGSLCPGNQGRYNLCNQQNLAHTPYLTCIYQL